MGDELPASSEVNGKALMLVVHCVAGSPPSSVAVPIFHAGMPSTTRDWLRYLLDQHNLILYPPELLTAPWVKFKGLLASRELRG